MQEHNANQIVVHEEKVISKKISNNYMLRCDITCFALVINSIRREEIATIYLHHINWQQIH